MIINEIKQGLFMFDLGFAEILVILIVALVVLGPEKLPKFAFFIGHTINKIKKIGQQIQTDLILHTHHPKIIDVGQSVKENIDNLTTQVKQSLSLSQQDTQSTQHRLDPLQALDNDDDLYHTKYASTHLSCFSQSRINRRNKYKQQINLNKKLYKYDHTYTIRHNKK